MEESKIKIQQEDNEINRGDFLKLVLIGSAAAAGLSQVKHLNGQAAKKGGESPYSWMMILDQKKCEGCEFCTNVCQAHNDINPEIQWNEVLESTSETGKQCFIARPCMHCEDAPCVSVCPVKASYYRADGIVMMDYDKCIGCRYCQIACPYEARSFNWKEFSGDNPMVPEWGLPEIERRPRGVVEKCSFCYQRIDRGLALGLTPGVDQAATPACVFACPTGARIFGDINDPSSPVSQAIKGKVIHKLRDELGTGTRFAIICPATDEDQL